MIGTVGKMAEPLFRCGLGHGAVAAVATFAAIGLLRWPLPWVLAALVPASVAAAWWVRR
jgi:chromate transporter